MPGRLTPAQMADLQKQYKVEFAQVYVTGAGKNGGGGKYYLIKGQPGMVMIPINDKVRLINHTHPQYHNGRVPLMPSDADRNVLKNLERAGSPQRTSQIVPEVGEPFLFTR